MTLDGLAQAEQFLVNAPNIIRGSAIPDVIEEKRCLLGGMGEYLETQNEKEMKDRRVEEGST